MNDLLPLGIACGDCARTKALRDGPLSVESDRVNYSARARGGVFRAFQNQEFALCELSFFRSRRHPDPDTPLDEVGPRVG